MIYPYLHLLKYYYKEGIITSKIRENSMKETNTRSFAKALSWRVIATTITICIAYLFTGEVKVALEIGGLDMVLKLIAYFFHERLWGRIRMGKILHPLAEVELKPGVSKSEVMKKLSELGYIDEVR